MNRKTVVAAALGCAVLAAPVSASTSPQAAERPVADVVDSALVATASESTPDPVVVAAAPTVRTWAKAAGASSTNPEQVPTVVLDAYTTAVAVAPAACNMTVPLLAAVGQVESGNLVGRSLDESHAVVPAVIGPRLDGGAFRSIADTDNGRLDGDKEFDRAVGPMQFLPATWRSVGVDMDGDGTRDPQNVYDAAGAAMVYLCGTRDLSDPAQLRQAILSYNRSQAYLQQVLTWKSTFETKGLGAIASLPIFSANGPSLTATNVSVTAAGTGAGKPGATATTTGKPRPGKTPPSADPSATPAGKPSATPSGTPSSSPTTPAVPEPAEPTEAVPSPSTPPVPSPSPSSPAPSPSGTPSASPSPAAELVRDFQSLALCTTPADPAQVAVTRSVFDILVFADVARTLAAYPDGATTFANGQTQVGASSLCEG